MGLGKEGGLPVSVTPYSYPAYSGPKLRTVPASHPTSNLAGSPGKSSSNTNSNSSTFLHLTEAALVQTINSTQLDP